MAVVGEPQQQSASLTQLSKTGPDMKILVIADGDQSREELAHELRASLDGCDVIEIRGREEFDRALARGGFDLAVTEGCVQWSDGLSILSRLKQCAPSIPVVMVTRPGDEEIAELGMKIGLDNCVPSEQTHRLAAVVIQSLNNARQRIKTGEALKESEDRFRLLFEPTGIETVMVVEDESLLLNLALTVLEEQGYTVLAATNGEDALRLAAEHGDKTIHLLVTDVMMPQMNGMELAKRLRASRPEMRTLYVSGYTDDAITKTGDVEVSVTFLRKPFSLSELATKVRYVLDMDT